MFSLLGHLKTGALKYFKNLLYADYKHWLNRNSKCFYQKRVTWRILMIHPSSYGMRRHWSLVIGLMDHHKMVQENSTLLSIHQRLVRQGRVSHELLPAAGKICPIFILFFGRGGQTAFGNTLREKYCDYFGAIFCVSLFHRHFLNQAKLSKRTLLTNWQIILTISDNLGNLKWIPFHLFE